MPNASTRNLDEAKIVDALEDPDRQEIAAILASVRALQADAEGKEYGHLEEAAHHLSAVLGGSDDD